MEKDRIKELEQALWEYGAHRTTCALIKNPKLPNDRCDCGLMAVLKNDET